MTHGLEAKAVLRWIYAARLIVAAGLYLGTALMYARGEGGPTLLASGAFILALGVTVASFFYTHVYVRPPGQTFRYLQSSFDLLLVTAVVHATGGSDSGFTALYILVIGAAALLHGTRGVWLVAALGVMLYFADVLLIRNVVFNEALWLQLALFCAVAFGSGFIGARLRAQGTVRQQLVDELARFRLREADMNRVRARADRLQAVAEMSASLAHEIKNPLAAIRSAAEQLGERSRTNEDEQSLVNLVTRESDRVSRILAEFLDFARLDIVARRTFDMRDVVHHAVELARSHPDGGDRVSVEAKMPQRALLVDGDPDVLHRAVFNLLLNALQASPTGSFVLVEAEQLSPRQTPVGEVAFLHGSIAVRVSDRGSGIPESIAERVFDPFFTTKASGSGLGLAVVQRSVTAHAGHVVVDSSSSGSRFTVLLPRSTEAVRAQRTANA